MRNYDGCQEDIKEADKTTANTTIDPSIVETEQEFLLEVIKPKSILQDRIAQVLPRLSQCTETDIEEFAEISETDQLLRYRFHEEVKNATKEGRPLIEARVYEGVCTAQSWRTLINKNEWKLAYMLLPVREYKEMQEMALQLLSKRILDIANASPWEGKGTKRKFNVKIGALQLKAYQELSARKHGSPVQRVEKNETTTSVSIEDMKALVDAHEKNGPVTIEVS